MNMNKKILLWVGGLILLLMFSMILSLMIGSVSVPPNLTVRILLNHLPFLNLEPNWSIGQESIVWNLRLPRVFLSLLVGAMLSIAGVAFQGVLRNPLADPYILGVSSGAALGAAMTILFGHQIGFLGQFSLPLFAFIGAIISLGLVILLTSTQHIRSNEILILAGVVIQAFSGAILTFLIALSGEKMQSIIFWMMGSLANHDWIDVRILLPYFLVGLLYLGTQYRELNILALGEQAATHLGIEVEKKKFYILTVASLLAAAAVSIVGIIGFVGLIIPHLIRLLTGPNHRNLLPISTLAGALFLLWADTIARTIIPSREIPIGVVTAMIGAPFFAYLLRKGIRREH
ncbi:hemin transport system permease protein HmuU [Tepidibacillus sp. HK-1]|nr:hemin transport system permease protein HmuU [Tepidibacillus sp. HK-1]